MNKMFLLGVLLFYSCIAHGQPVPDCAKTEKRLFIVSKENLACSLGQYNANPTGIGQWTTCFKVEHWKFIATDTAWFYTFKIYPSGTPWPPEKYGKYDSCMTITMNTKQLPDSFNYYLDVTYAQGKYCLHISDSLKNKAVAVPCNMCKDGETVNAIDITPVKWIECQNKNQSLKENKGRSKKR